MTSEIKQTCRLCLDPASSIGGSSTSIDDDAFRIKLATVSHLMLVTGDHLPSAVCSECCYKVTEFYDFIETVRSNQDQLGVATDTTRIKEEPILSEVVSVKVQTPECNDDEEKNEDQAYVPEVEYDDSSEDKDYDPTVLDQKSEESDDEEDLASLKREFATEKSVTVDEENNLIKKYFSLGCESCSESFETWRELAKHTKQTHKKTASVHCCNKTFNKKCTILYHINTHLKPFQCEVCGKGFVDKYALNQHILQKHGSDEDKPFKCDQCGQSFHKKHLLNTHKKVHVQVECTICKKMLSNEYTLKNHMTSQHHEGDMFICYTCGKQFRSRYVLNSHVRRHLGQGHEEMVECSLCNKRLNKQHLTEHMKTVHNGTKVTCDVCFKEYPYEKALQTHKRRVHVAKMFGCEICGKEFKRRVNLREHVASHTGEKLYSCEVCGMEMNSNANLYTHKKNKHPAEWLLGKQK